MSSGQTPTSSTTIHLAINSTRTSDTSITPVATLRSPFYSALYLVLSNATTIDTATSWRAQVGGSEYGGDMLNFKDISTAVAYNWTFTKPALGTFTEYHTCNATDSTLTWCSSATVKFQSGSIESASGTTFYTGEDDLRILATVTGTMGGGLYQVPARTSSYSLELPTWMATTTGTFCLCPNIICNAEHFRQKKELVSSKYPVQCYISSAPLAFLYVTRPVTCGKHKIEHLCGISSALSQLSRCNSDSISC
jgi:hypothetical protein